MTAHALNPDSRRAQALRYLRTMGGWVGTRELAIHLDLDRTLIAGNLAVALRSRVVEKRTGPGRAVEWRMTPPDPNRQFSIGWPTGFVPLFDKVVVPAYEVRSR